MKISATAGTLDAVNIGAAATCCNGSHGLSPDGQWLAISCSMPDKPESRVYIVPSGGGTPRLITENPNLYWHSWSPDGKTIVFTRPDPHGSLNIYAIPKLKVVEESGLDLGFARLAMIRITFRRANTSISTQTEAAVCRSGVCVQMVSGPEQVTLGRLS